MLDFILIWLGLKKKREDNRQGYAGMSASELAKVGIIPIQQNSLTLAGQRWKNAQVFTPMMYRIIQICFLIICLSFLVMVGSVLFRKSPLLLISFPNGSVRCGGQNIDMSRHVLKPRTAAQQQLCNALEQRWTTPLTNADDDAVALAQQAQQHAQQNPPPATASNNTEGSQSPTSAQSTPTAQPETSPSPQNPSSTPPPAVTKSPTTQLQPTHP